MSCALDISQSIIFHFALIAVLRLPRFEIYFANDSRVIVTIFNGDACRAYRFPRAKLFARPLVIDRFV